MKKLFMVVGMTIIYTVSIAQQVIIKHHPKHHRHHVHHGHHVGVGVGVGVNVH